MKATELLLEISHKLDEIKTNSKEILGVEEAAKYLGVSKSYIYFLTSKGKVPFRSPGGKKVFFVKDELVQWITNSKL